MLDQYMVLIGQYRKNLLYSIAHSFFSSYGQTFFLSLFVPYLLAHFQLTQTSFGMYYGIVTVCSACLLPIVGSLIDSTLLTRYSLFAFFLLGTSYILLASSNHVYLFIAALFLVRFSGQALMSHISVTSITRFFIQTRGKAVSFAMLGYALGEGGLPILVVKVLQEIEWQQLLLALGFIALTAGVLLQLMFKKDDPFVQPTISMDQQKGLKKLILSKLCKDPYLYLILPGLLAPPFILTAVILNHSQLASTKGWEPQLLAQGFILYACARVIATLFSGPFIDRYSAKKLLPLIYLPLLFSFYQLCTLDTHATAYFYLGGAGFAMGLVFTISGVLWPEIYGTQVVGSIRSLLSPCIVLSTAISPYLWGLSIDHGFHVEEMLWGCFGIFVFSFVLLILSSFVPSRVGHISIQNNRT